METKPSLSRDQRMQANADKLEEVKIKQINGEIEKIPANIDSDYEIDKNDEAYVHIEVKKKHKQPGDAEDLIEKRVIKLHPELMKPSEDSGMFKQYSSFKIVHDPRKEGYSIATKATKSELEENNKRAGEYIEAAQSRANEAEEAAQKIAEENASLKAELEALKNAPKPETTPAMPVINDIEPAAHTETVATSDTVLPSPTDKKKGKG